MKTKKRPPFLPTWKQSSIPLLSQQGKLLKQGILALDELSRTLPVDPLRLNEQPFDLQLLAQSSLYRKSRILYCRKGLEGTHRPSFLSPKRSLGSPILLEPEIQYSPVESEMIWAASDPVESKNLDQLLELRKSVTCVYHEQNHRILWNFLPPSPKSGANLRRYLNFSEALVITLDMALADELGPRLAILFYLSGATYDPGTDLKSVLTQRHYRNYLQALNYATYLNLEFFSGEDIREILFLLFPQMEPLLDRIVQRSTNLDRQFVEATNPIWQKRHGKSAGKLLGDSAVKPLQLSRDPLENWKPYLITEHILDHFKIE